MAKWFGHHGASLVVGLTALTLAGLPIFSGANRGMPDFCHVFNRIYLNGEIFTAPGDTRCVQQICINGSVDFHQEACFDSDTGECHLVGSDYLWYCNTYTCMRRYINGDIDYHTLKLAAGRSHLCRAVLSYKTVMTTARRSHLCHAVIS
ncbi:hypothetical protein BsWGS_03412 [Bradybaena similaris]